MGNSAAAAAVPSARTQTRTRIKYPPAVLVLYLSITTTLHSCVLEDSARVVVSYKQV